MKQQKVTAQAQLDTNYKAAGCFGRKYVYLKLLEL